MSVFARIARASIWAKDAPSMQRVQKRFRPVFRYGLPAVDVLLIVFSIAGFVIGSTAVREFTTPWFGPLLAGGIGVASVFALVGLAFNRPRMELTAKFTLGACLALYEAFLIASATVRSASAVLTAVLVTIVLVILALRIFDLLEQAAIEEGDE